ncbi:hypothetical protein HPB48_018022 [Haemaphysalis longicornis]|uniref:Cytochrome b5 heme-binding domain-containing protein n=1 Tax=Haemaphysalis longicornis TaxID=44386 RepID=A0A9J6FH38_HAELO|nr:hypothetical protein HPB48_018022 [Haemaphysalis longicornis]
MPPFVFRVPLTPAFISVSEARAYRNASALIFSATPSPPRGPAPSKPIGFSDTKTSPPQRLRHIANGRAFIFRRAFSVPAALPCPAIPKAARAPHSGLPPARISVGLSRARGSLAQSYQHAGRAELPRGRRQHGPSASWGTQPRPWCRRPPIRGSGGEGGRKGSQLPRYTLHDVCQHCHQNDCWIVIHNRVYDVTSFLAKVRLSSPSSLYDAQEGEEEGQRK